nr:hypothetical protein GCM10025732_42000 [Glycomyces mayteni]
MRGVDGVDSADGDVSGQVNAIGDNGKLVGAFAPTIGFNWNDDGAEGDGYNEIRDGRGPQADGEVIVSAQFVADAGLSVGDTVTAYSYSADRADYEIVGVFGLPGGRDSSRARPRWASPPPRPSACSPRARTPT